MDTSVPASVSLRPPSPAVVLELLKPLTWFAPMWAYGCGVLSSGQSITENWVLLLGGVVLAGPMVCGASQAVNDWFDRHVDALNQPERPIPSGRMPGRWGLWVAIVWTLCALLVAAPLGPWAWGATAVGLLLAWAYSAPPVRLKLSGVWGPLAVGFSYEGLAWFTGAAVMTGALPEPRIIALAVLYSIGAHGIMTLNDFKAIEGDAAMGVRSLPVVLGPDRAARVACVTMAVPQVMVVGLLVLWGSVWAAGAVATLTLGQVLLMRRLLRAPRDRAPWYNATGTSLYVLGMAAAAVAIPMLP